MIVLIKRTVISIVIGIPRRVYSKDFSAATGTCVDLAEDWDY